jgi:ribosome-interacting GTPase 1
MAEMTLHVETPKDKDAQKLAQEIQRRLAALRDVEEVEAIPESTRFAAELIAGIAITVSIIKGSGEIAEALHKVIPKIKVVLQDLGLTKAQVEVAGDLVPIDEVTRSHTQKMSA